MSVVSRQETAELNVRMISEVINVILFILIIVLSEFHMFDSAFPIPYIVGLLELVLKFGQ